MPAAVPALDDARIISLLTQAKLRAGNNDWTTPPGSSAVDRYRQVIRLDPDNEEAKQGIVAAFDFFLRRGNELAAAGDPAGARVRYGKARAVLESAGVEAHLTDLAERRVMLDQALVALEQH